MRFGVLLQLFHTMGKRDLKKYLTGLDKAQLEAQFIDLYDKFPEVKTYYDFVFNPREEKLVREAKAKISNEYFPVKTKRAKLRRSTAQKFIKHFLVLGVDPFAVADVMLHAIEVAQKYTAKREVRYNSFYKSMYNSFAQAADYIIGHGLAHEFEPRLLALFQEAQRQKWPNIWDFDRVMARF